MICSASWVRTSDGTGYDWDLVKRRSPSASECIAPTWVELNAASVTSRSRQLRGWLRLSTYLQSSFYLCTTTRKSTLMASEFGSGDDT